jgi:organic radical activating enzyme
VLAKLLGVRVFDLEASSRCNVRCRYCPRELLPETGLMSQETFSRFLDGVELNSTDNVSFVGLGEPTLNPRLAGFVREVKSRFPATRTWVTTNGTNLNTRTIPPLLSAGLDTLDISFNGLDQMTYELNMRGASFEGTLANVDYARREAERAGGRTRVQINYIVSAENAGKEEAIQAFWRARGIGHFRVQRMHDRAGAVAVEGMTPGDAPGLAGAGCRLFEVFNFISWRGQALYCCHDLCRTHVIGNVNVEPWAAVADCKRELAGAGHWPAMCARCTDPLRRDVRRLIDATIRRELAGRLAGGWAALSGWRRRSGAPAAPQHQVAGD